MLINKYKTKCSVCQISLDAGVGFAVKNQEGRWQAVCQSSICISKKVPEKELNRFKELNETKTDGDNIVSNRKLTANGEIIMPYDATALPLIKSFPGAKYQGDGIWKISLAIQDRQRVLELSKKLNLVVDDSLKEFDLPSAVIDAVNRAIKLGLYKYQQIGVQFLSLRDKALLGDDLGVGKTAQANCAIPDNSKIIIVCPASLKYNWQAEFEKWRSDIKTEILSGRENFKLPHNNEAVIINYDILPKWLQKPGKDASEEEKKEYKKIFKEKEKDFDNVVLIVDEAHCLKNYKTKRSQKMKTLSSICSKVWFLTGTPLLNRPFDLYGVLSSGNMANDVFSFNRFIELFNGHRSNFGGYVFGSPQDSVSEVLKKVMLRRLKKEVLSELPNKTYKEIHLDCPKSIVKEMDDFYEEYEEFYDSDELPSFEDISRLRAKLAEVITPQVIEIVEEYEEQDVPLIVFSAHKYPVETIGVRGGWEFITGDTPLKRRNEIVKSFQAGELKGVALTIQAAGIGLTLTRSSNVLFVNLDWTPALNLQAEDRAHRIGQKNNVLITRIRVNHALDKRVHELLVNKINMIQKALDEELQYNAPSQEIPDNLEIIEETEEDFVNRTEHLNKLSDNFERNRILTKVKTKIEQLNDIKFPIITDDISREIRGAWDHMLGICDGAQEKDRVGFNKPDAIVAHMIMPVLDDQNALNYAWHILQKYRRQLENKYKLIYGY